MSLPKIIKQPLFWAALLVIVIGAVTTILVHNANADGQNDFDVDSVLPPPVSQPAIPSKKISSDELKKNDGKNGHHCFVAVSGVVYEIQEGKLWNNGKHDTSNGLAYCGADLTEAIKQSPHGTSKLQELTPIGRYAP